MKSIIITPKIEDKLDEKHTVSPKEVAECFENKCGLNLIDDRENHRTNPPSLWFISESNKGRPLKVIFIYRDGNIHLKSAYEPDQNEIDIYESEGK